MDQGSVAKNYSSQGTHLPPLRKQEDETQAEVPFLMAPLCRCSSWLPKQCSLLSPFLGILQRRQEYLEPTDHCFPKCHLWNPSMARCSIEKRVSWLNTFGKRGIPCSPHIEYQCIFEYGPFFRHSVGKVGGLT